MNQELNLHIKKLQNRARISLVFILTTILSIGFGILFLFVPSFVSIIFFATAIFSIIYLICSSRSAKREAKEKIYEPVKFTASRNFAFEEIVDIFENMTEKENQLSTSENVRFFRLKKYFKLRAVLYKTVDFNKADFDNAKARINKKANKELNISQKVNLLDAGNMMRFNIVYADTLSDDLYRFMYQNTNSNLTRAEGIINIAIVGNQIILPPLYGECDLMEISRYKDTIKFISKVFLKDE